MKELLILSRKLFQDLRLRSTDSREAVGVKPSHRQPCPEAELNVELEESVESPDTKDRADNNQHQN